MIIYRRPPAQLCPSPDAMASHHACIYRNLSISKVFIQSKPTSDLLDNQYTALFVDPQTVATPPWRTRAAPFTSNSHHLIYKPLKSLRNSFIPHTHLHQHHNYTHIYKLFQISSFLDHSHHLRLIDLYGDFHHADWSDLHWH